MLVYDGRSGWEVGRAATGEVASGREVVVERQQSLEFRVFGLQWPPALEKEVGGGSGAAAVAVRPAAEEKQRRNATGRPG